MKSDQLIAAVKEFFELMETEGMSDSGKSYRVYSIGCSHAGQEQRMADALSKMKNLVE